MRLILLMTRRILKRGLTGTLFLLLGLFIFEFVQPLVANSVGGGAGIAGLIESLPPAFQAMLRTRPEFMAVSGLAGYLSIGFSHPIYFVLTTALLAALICRSLAGEYESGTMQLALSRSVSRAAIYMSRLIATVIVMMLAVVFTLGGLLAGIRVGHPAGDLAYSHLLPTAAAALLLMWGIAGVTLLLSALANTTSQAVGWTAGFVVVSFVIEYLAGLWSAIEPFGPISLYHYFDPATALIAGRVASRDVAVLLLTGLIGSAAGYRVFRDRDLPS